MTAANAGFQGDDVGCLSSLFYANDSAIGSLDPDWLQRANQHLCNLFRDCTGLMPNTEKTESMSYHPEAIGVQRLAINVATKAPARPTAKGRGKGLCVLVLDAVRLLQ